jgi:hypothetical protein
MLADHAWLDADTASRLYQALLRLAFDAPPISYSTYLAIAQCLGGPPHGALRREMLRLQFGDFAAWLLTKKAEDADEEIIKRLREMGVEAAEPMTHFQFAVAAIRPQEQPVLFDFAVQYLRSSAQQPGRELKRNGYFADTLAEMYGHDLAPQRARLEPLLRAAGYSSPLREQQITELGIHPDVGLTPALMLTVAMMAQAGRPAPATRRMPQLPSPDASLSGSIPVPRWAVLLVLVIVTFVLVYGALHYGLRA